MENVSNFSAVAKLCARSPSTQVNELGEIETPILLTSTLNVPRVADALTDYMLGLPGNEAVLSINLQDRLEPGPAPGGSVRRLPVAA
jgi:hypothetical protein